MKKKFEHEEIEICILCGRGIATDMDGWVALIDYEGEKQDKIGFYHRNCLDDLIKGKGEVIQQKFRQSLGNVVGGMLNRLKGGEVIEI